MRRFTVLPAAAVAEATADRFVSAARSAIDARDIFRVALSGGSTPKQVYPLLLQPRRRDAVDWSKVEFFWGDERAVPPDHPDSNFGAAYQALIAQLPDVRPDRIHRMPAEAPDIDAAALSHESELRLAFGARASELPAFDLIWLGMGPDGHTASLFPGTLAIEEDERWVVGNWVPSLDTWRMTLTYPILDAARYVVFAVTGADKADAVRRIRAGGSGLPAEAVSGRRVEWIADAAAAGEPELA